MEDLFKQSAVVASKRRRRDEEDDAPVLVSDAGQAKRLLLEAVGELIDGAADYTRMTLKEMKAAGYRPWLDEQVPYVVEQLVVSGLQEPQFKAMVKYCCNPRESGTGIFGLVRREPGGDWAIAAVQARDNTAVKMDHKRERSRGMATGTDGVEWDPSVPAPSDFVGIRKPVIEWMVVWVDRNKAQPVKRDMHGRENKVAEVNVDTGGERLAAVLEKLVPSSPATPAVPAATAPAKKLP